MPWYYAGPESTPVGPLSTEELRARAAAGSLAPDTYIIEHAEGAPLAWRRYREVFPPAEPPPVNVPRPTTHSVRLTAPAPAPAPVIEPPVAPEPLPVPRVEPEAVAPLVVEEPAAVISEPAPEVAEVVAPAPIAPVAVEPPAPVIASLPVIVEREPALVPTPVAPQTTPAPQPSSIGETPIVAPAAPVAPPKREPAPTPIAKPEREALLPVGTPTSGPVPAVQPATSSAMTVQAPLMLKPMPYPLRPTNGWCAWGFGLGLAGFCLSLICGIGVALAVPSLVLSAIGLVQVMRNRQQHGQALAVAGLALSTLGVAVAVAYFMWLAVPIIRAHGLTVTEQTSNDSE